MCFVVVARWYGIVKEYSQCPENNTRDGVERRTDANNGSHDNMMLESLELIIRSISCKISMLLDENEVILLSGVSG
jgi:hypothetical protein